MQRWERNIDRDFREIFETAQDRKIQEDANRQSQASGPSAEPFPKSKVHYCRSEKNAHEPDAPTDIKNVAAHDQNGQPNPSRADFGEDHNADQKNQTI